jgi:hypothetical protein
MLHWAGGLNSAPMFTLAFERTHRVLLVRFTGIFSSEDIVPLERAVKAFVDQEGPVRHLLDFSGIEAIAVPQTLVAERARLPEIVPGQERVIVAADLEMYDLARGYATQQRDFGNLEPRVVLSLWDAYRLLGLDEADFQAIR